MSNSKDRSTAWLSPWLRRLGGFLLAAWLIGLAVERVANKLYVPGERAGLGLGIVHGAMMPLAMPNLLVGRDMTIYAPLNDGQPYKLGYTLGVNGCGLLFFGFSFWRIRRLRQAVPPP